MTPQPSPAQIRQWAREQGMTVGLLGRLSPDLVAAYAARTEAPSIAAPPGRPLAARTVAVRPAPGATGVGHTIRARTG